MQRLITRIADAPREKLLWIAIGTLVVAQIIAFWMLCRHQVRQAEVRHAAVQVEKMALADCMRYIPKATLSSCNARVTAQAQPANSTLFAAEANTAAGLATMSSATPVGFNFR